MLSRPLSTLLSKISSRLVQPTSLPLSKHLPHHTTLFHDPPSKSAIAVLSRRTHLPLQTAQEALSLLDDMRSAHDLHHVALAVRGDITVPPAASRAARAGTGEDVQRITDTRPSQRRFELVSEHEAAGDQPKAISFLTRHLETGRRFQTLHGVTGSGKTFMMAKTIANLNRPTLILAPNKTLAAQLCNELARYFPRNRVDYFVSHYKFYLPESYLPASDKYIAKASAVDDDIDRLRHAATKALFERSDTIVVASVSAIYGLGLPTEYLEAAVRVKVGERIEGVGERLRALNYVRGSLPLKRGEFLVGDDEVDVSPPWEAEGILYRILMKDEVVLGMQRIEVKTGECVDLGSEVVIYPAKHFVTPQDRLEVAIREIEAETERCVAAFLSQGKSLEASRLQERVATDVEMMRKVGFCSGAENYTLYLSGRHAKKNAGPPETLLDYMPKDGKWLLFIDESHVTVPQLGAMYAGNAARKRKLIKHGFRLPSAMENRPLSSKEFWGKVSQTVFVSATPGSCELQNSGKDGVVEAVIRPTGVVDPTVEVVGTKGQIEHLTLALAKVVAEGGRAIVTTLTKRFAEDVADCLAKKPPINGVLERQLRVSFLHSGIDSVGRMQVLEAMREEEGALDVVVGVNLLREGIDLPAVRLVAILDADSEGFLRGETALIQTIGRAARNIDGHVIMYADTMTTGMHKAIAETKRRRRLQVAYNDLYNITPRRVGADAGGVDTLLDRIRKIRLAAGDSLNEKSFGDVVQAARRSAALGCSGLEDADEVRQRMLEAAEKEDFETAALLRDHLARMEAAGQGLESLLPRQVPVEAPY